MNGAEITPTNSMKYLGVVLDHNLSWTPHIQEKVSKAINFLHMIKPAINHIYDPDPKRMGLETGSVAQAYLWLSCVGSLPYTLR